ncbi:hypothetical protein D3C72_1502830 [compost metagenome]
MAGDDLGFVVIGGVDLRELAQGHDHGAHQERQQGQLAAAVAPLLVQVQAQLFQCRDVDLFDIAEVRDTTLGILHALGDLAAQADDRDLLAVGTFAVAGGCTLAAAGRLGEKGVQVFMQDAPGRAAAVDITQFDTGIQGALAHGRGGQRAFVGFARDDGCGACCAGGGRAGYCCRLLWHRLGFVGDYRGWRRFLFGWSTASAFLMIARAFDFNADQLAAHRHDFTGLPAQGQDFTAHWRRNFHGGLVGHDIGHDLVFGDGVADFDEPFHQFNLCDAFTDIRHLDDVRAHSDLHDPFQCRAHT